MLFLYKGKGSDKMNKRQRNKWIFVNMDDATTYWENNIHKYRNLKLRRSCYNLNPDGEIVMAFRTSSYKSIDYYFAKQTLKFMGAPKPHRNIAYLRACWEIDGK